MFTLFSLPHHVPKEYDFTFLLSYLVFPYDLAFAGIFTVCFSATLNWFRRRAPTWLRQWFRKQDVEIVLGVGLMLIAHAVDESNLFTWEILNLFQSSLSQYPIEDAYSSVLWLLLYFSLHTRQLDKQCLGPLKTGLASYLVAFGVSPADIVLGQEDKVVNYWKRAGFREFSNAPALLFAWYLSFDRQSELSFWAIILEPIAVWASFAVIFNIFALLFVSFDHLADGSFFPCSVLDRFHPFQQSLQSWLSISLYGALSSLEESVNQSRANSYDKLPMFKFEKLHHESEIRILCLNKRTLFQPPSCQLVTARVEEASNFVVCSYSGESESTKLIILNGRRFYVPLEAYQVLRRKQSFFGETQLWVAAICVDLSDPRDKKQQRSNVKGILRSATRLDAFIDLRYAYSSISSFLAILANPHATASENTLSPGWSGQWEELATLLNQDWFYRIWIIPEVALSREVSLINGVDVIDWELLVTALKRAEENSMIQLQLETVCGRRSVEDRFSTETASYPLVMDSVRRGVLLHDEISMLNLLGVSTNLQMPEQGDRIMALLPIAPTEATDSLSTDTRTSFRELLARTMEYILSAEQSIQVIAHAGIQNQSSRDQFPSWVSDWTQTEGDVLADHIFGEWAASNRYHADIQVHQLDETLFLKTKFIGRILAIGPVWPSEISATSSDRQLAQQEEMELLEQERRFLRSSWWMASKYYDPSLQATDQVICHDLCCTLRMLPNGMMSQIIWTHGAVGWGYTSSSSRGGSPSPKDEYRFESEEQVRENMRAKCIAIISPDRMAAIPEAAVDSDEVHLIAGAQTPFVLRPIKSYHRGSDPVRRFQLVGPCYVIGAMNGEFETGPPPLPKDLGWRKSCLV